jgi:hypothetical protein
MITSVFLSIFNKHQEMKIGLRKKQNLDVLNKTLPANVARLRVS